jgi:hypothetical protein
MTEDQKSYWLMIFRNLLTVAGGVLATNGYVTSTAWTQVTGACLVLVSFALDHIDWRAVKKRVAQAESDIPPDASKLISSLLRELSGLKDAKIALFEQAARQPGPSVNLWESMKESPK